MTRRDGRKLRRRKSLSGRREIAMRRETRRRRPAIDVGGVDHHQSGATALLRRFNDRPLQSRNLACPRFDDRSLGDERDQSRNAKLCRFFHQPVEPIGLGYRSGQNERKGRRALGNRLARPQSDRPNSLLHRDDPATALHRPAVEDLDLVTDSEPANAAQVLGLASFEAVDAVDWEDQGNRTERARENS